MVVLLEFTIDAEGFVIGEILKQATGVYTVELERVIPLGERPIPFLWVTSDDLDTFEENVLSHPLVQKIHKLERIDDHGLYRIEWAEDPPNNLLAGIQNTNGTLLDAHGGENWFFRLRFPSHELVGEFYNFCTEHSIPIHIERVVPLSEIGGPGPIFDLTAGQREALLITLERGYFDTPRQVTLTELAEEFDVTSQALSDRIRRGVKEVLVKSLSAPVDG